MIIRALVVALLILCTPGIAVAQGVIRYGAVKSYTTNGTITATGVFQSVLAADIGRNGCFVVNTSASAMSVYLGPVASATAAQALPLPAGQTFNCGSFQGTVANDEISLTGTTAATFVVVRQ